MHVCDMLKPAAAVGDEPAQKIIVNKLRSLFLCAAHRKTLENAEIGFLLAQRSSPAAQIHYTIHIIMSQTFQALLQFVAVMIKSTRPSTRRAKREKTVKES